MANTKVTSRVLADDLALAGNPTTTTQSAGNNTTRIATTAFVTTAVSNLVDSAPSALDTLNELAAALGDDASFSTTVTNSIATKLPLAGGTMTGDLTISTAGPSILLTDTDNNPDYQIKNGNGSFRIIDTTNSVDRININTSGNVGIGTATPGASTKLNVAGRALFTAGAPDPGDSTSAGVTIGYDTSNNFGFVQAVQTGVANKPLHIQPLGTDALIIGAAGANVGIGTTSPGVALDINRATGTASYARVGNGGNVQAYIGVAGDNLPVLGSYTNHALRMVVNASEVARFATGGSFLVAKTSIGLSSVGFETSSGGRTRITRDNANVVEVNRKSSNGGLITFYKDATAVGSIGSQGGANIYITSGNRGVRLNDGDFSPITSGNSYSDNSVDLGRSTARFKDLYLSGGAYLGGTTSANFLDDYEEGTWTPVYQGGSSNPSVSYNIQQGRYTKVGRLVVAHCRLRTSAVSSQGSGYLAVGGLPFASLNVHNIFGSGIVSYTGGGTWNDDNAPSRAYVNTNATQAVLVRYDTDDPRDEGSTSVNAADLATASSRNDLIITCVYAAA